MNRGTTFCPPAPNRFIWPRVPGRPDWDPDDLGKARMFGLVPGCPTKADRIGAEFCEECSGARTSGQ